MSDVRWRKVARDLWRHKPRTILVVLAIAIGITGAGAVLDTWALLRRVVDVGYRATDPPAATLRTDPVDAALLALVRALPAVRDAQARRTVYGRALVGGAWRPLALFAPEDFGAIRIGKVRTVAGAWPPADGEIAIERSSLEVAEAGIGEQLAVRIGEGAQRSLAITGIARDAGLAPGWMEHVIYGFATPATLAQLGAPSSLNELRIVTRDSALDQEGVRRVAFDVKAAAEAAGRRVTGVEVPVPGRHIHADQMNSLLYTQAAFGVLALLLSGLLVVNLITAMLAGQVREIGMMKAVGGGSGQIAAMYLTLALVLGVLACLIAIPAGALIGHWYAEFAAGMLNFETKGVPIPRGIIALQLAVGALLPVAAAAIPVWRGCRLSVSEALRDFGIAGTGDGGGRVLAGVGGISRPLLLSLRNAFRRRQRMMLTLLSLAMGGAVFLGALDLRASIRSAIGSIFAAIRYDLVVQLGRPYPAARLEEAARRVPGVARAEAWGGGGAAVGRPDGSFGNAFAVSAVTPASTMMAYPVLRGRWLRAGDVNALVASSRLMDQEPRLTLGGEVTLVVGGRPSRWTVVGVVSSFPGSAYAPHEAWAAVAGEAGVERVAIAVEGADAVTRAEVRRRVHEALAADGFEVTGSVMVAENRAAVEDHLLMVAGFLLVMSWAMIAVGGLGLASTMSLAVLERTREIGVLRAIGARHRAIHTMVQVEGLVIGVLSWAIAVPLSWPVSAALGAAFGRIMFKAPIATVLEPSGILVWLGVVLVVSVVASAWPAFRATRVTTAAALAYE